MPAPWFTPSAAGVTNFSATSTYQQVTGNQQIQGTVGKGSPSQTQPTTAPSGPGQNPQPQGTFKLGAGAMKPGQPRAGFNIGLRRWLPALFWVTVGLVVLGSLITVFGFFRRRGSRRTED